MGIRLANIISVLIILYEALPPVNTIFPPSKLSHFCYTESVDRIVEKDFKKNGAVYVRNFTFGVEDSLVSTVGLLSGIAIAGTPKETIILAGVILLFVEAFSMGVGSIVSENSTEEFEEKRELPLRRSILAGLTMFISYLVAGFVPLVPYFLFESIQALALSVILSLCLLFLLGLLSARVSNTNPLHQGTLFLSLGGIAIVIGVLVGTVLKI